MTNLDNKDLLFYLVHFLKTEPEIFSLQNSDLQDLYLIAENMENLSEKQIEKKLTQFYRQHFNIVNALQLRLEDGREINEIKPSPERQTGVTNLFSELRKIVKEKLEQNNDKHPETNN
ncbi:MAG: hypothetical protein AB4290_09860 [Spirulina sp.]